MLSGIPIICGFTYLSPENSSVHAEEDLFSIIEEDITLHKSNYPLHSIVVHCLDRTPDCTFLGTGSLLPRWRTGKPTKGRYLFYNHFISI